MKTFRDIVNQELALIGQLYENEGELTPEMEAQLAITNDMKAEKVEGYYNFIKRLNAEIGRWSDEYKKLGSYIKSMKNTLKWAENNLKTGMIDLEQPVLTGDVHEFTISPGKSKVVILDQDEIPAKYLREKVIYEPDKVAIKEALEAGEVVRGCKLESVYTLRNRIRKDK